MTNSTVVVPYSSLYLVQNKIKSHFAYNTKIDNYGQVENWVLPDSYVSSSLIKNKQHAEFALTCRYVCQYGKFVSRLIICQTDDDELRCSLLVGDWVLDFINDEPVHIDMLLDCNKSKILYISGFCVGDVWSPYVK